MQCLITPVPGFRRRTAKITTKPAHPRIDSLYRIITVIGGQQREKIGNYAKGNITGVGGEMYNTMLHGAMLHGAMLHGMEQECAV